MKRFLQPVAPVVALLALAACSGGAGSTSMPGASAQLPTSSQARSAASQMHSESSGVQRACPAPQRGGDKAQCLVLFHTGTNPQTPAGHGPPDFYSAYNFNANGGTGQVVAAVDAFDQPNITTDIKTYDTEYSLPAANFIKVNQEGQQSDYPSPNQGWGLEESLDVEMLSAGCNLCTIYLVEANSNSNSDLQAAVAEAAKLGATVISNSYQGGTGSYQAYDIPGVTILASGGDGGYGTGDPADFSTVVAVGGTNLTKGGGGSRGWTETVWNGTGSGCSPSGAGYTRPSYQKTKDTPGCTNKVNNDISAVATDTAVADSYGYGGWVTVDGTSISSPLMASLFGLAGNSTKQDGGKTFWKKKNQKYLNDITQGSNGNCSPSYLCTAGPGYDGPSGWGTPNGIKAF